MRSGPVSSAGNSATSSAAPVCQLVRDLPAFCLTHRPGVSHNEADFMHDTIQRLPGIPQPVQGDQRGKPRSPVPEGRLQIPRASNSSAHWRYQVLTVSGD